MTAAGKFIAGMSSTLLMLASHSVGAVDVYKWTSTDGVTHYGEAPPESSLSSLEVLDVSIAEPASPAVANYRSALEVASSIETSRLERERARLEKQKLVLQERQLKQSQQAAQQRNDAREADTNVYYPPYRRYRLPYPRRDRHYPDPEPNTARTHLNR